MPLIGLVFHTPERIESLCKDYSVPLLVSESTKAQAAGYSYNKLGEVQVKGKREILSIYHPGLVTKQS